MDLCLYATPFSLSQFMLVSPVYVSEPSFLIVARWQWIGGGRGHEVRPTADASGSGGVEMVGRPYGAPGRGVGRGGHGGVAARGLVPDGSSRWRHKRKACDAAAAASGLRERSRVSVFYRHTNRGIPPRW